MLFELSYWNMFVIHIRFSCTNQTVKEEFENKHKQ